MAPSLFKDAFWAWREDKAPRMGAALAFYTIFSLAPLLLIVIAIAGLVFGREAAQGQIVQQIEGLVGEEGARAIQVMLERTSKPSAGILAGFVGVVTLLFGATGVFAELQDSLNSIWKVKPKPGSGVMEAIKDRFVSFAMILGIGFLLLVSLVLSAALAVLGQLLNSGLPSLLVVHTVNVLLSFGVITVLFAMMYRFLPDAEVAWRDVWLGAALTSLLFTVGKSLIGFYLGTSGVASAYGAAGSLVVVLLWVNYSALIFFYGAEFTRVYEKRGRQRILKEVRPRAVSG